MSESVLNPGLYANMVRCGRFGRVRVINRGQPLEGFHQPDPVRGGTSFKVIRRGETYVGCCPHCGDSRDRLAVNHMFGVSDPMIPGSWKHWELWKCYNEECQRNSKYRGDMRFWLGAPFLGGLKLRPPSLVVASRPALEPIEFPGLTVPIDELPEDHEAVRYVRSRRFDPGYLAREWGVSYAVSVPARSRGAMSQGRIIVPVYRDRAMVGWQARYPGEMDWKASGVPKYLTYFPKSQTLYGIDEAATADFVVLVEGVTDVWRCGPGAVSGLGKTLSRDQSELLAARLNGRYLILVPDMDDADSEINFYRSAAAVVAAGHKGPIGVAPLPKGKDPADLDTKTLRSIIVGAAFEATTPSPHESEVD